MTQDHNLLFGILAVQMTLIDRDAFIEGMRAWVLKSHEGLDDILREQDKSDPSQIRMIHG